MSPNKVDRRLATLRKWSSRFGPQIAELFGTSAPKATIGLGSTDDNNPAYTTGSDVFFDPAYLKRTSRADLRGALIHELTHVAGVKADTGRVETAADYARYTLNPRENPDWKPSEDVLAMAARRGDDVAAYTDTKGPRVGNRNRNSVRNNLSKATPPAPLVGPGATLGYGQQSASATTSLYERLAAIKAQKGLVKAQAIQGRADAKAAGIAGVSDAVNSALDRGILRSSVDYAGRTGALAEKERMMQDVIAQKSAGMLGLGQERIAAFNDFYNTQFGIQSQRAADQSEASIQAFMNDLVLGLGLGGGGGGGVPGAKPSGAAAAAMTPQQLEYIKLVLAGKAKPGLMGNLYESGPGRAI